ncbi:DNA mismatch repair protein MutS2 [Acetitomaculum ruminis DSM 5522]|uniref:Endonuclease MutS2 n=1 Tax=Acetitomaculum ruminis DSM 5522 TaxID=1120918 RepID=A0A1I0XFS4_9FIRM|nr:endonuclease MutS2 [Acetitomaculum ruminis]SFA99150.1 DNA mismatch repair protein MutS2 [Acetitomaculum ruminis DSM 5522]
MKEKFYKALEFDKIIALLEKEAASKAGEKLCHELLPMTNINDISVALNNTNDALTRIFKKGTIPLGGLCDIGFALKHLKIGGSLSQKDLIDISSVLYACKNVKNYAGHEREDEPEDSLDQYFEPIEPLVSLKKEIDRCIISETEVSDNASPALNQIRRKINNINNSIHNQINSLLSNNTVRSYLQDAVITLRNDRYCLPVKAEFKNSVPGLIHDTSSTGSTIFVEPMSVVKLNNDLKELYNDEKKAIEEILENLSQLCSQYIENLSDNFHYLSLLDFIFAKANLGLKYNGTMPKLNTNGHINFKKARHPLIDPKKVVPVNVYLGKDFTTLIITGPNTGGKTVSLKTVGLLTLMGQAGLLIPAGDGSTLAVFKEVYADIGDEQSIEQSLSTFSAHMTKIVEILKNVSKNSLVLFDELGAGTDPTEGAALATSILDMLHERHINTMATTHYSELKVYALSTPGVENASCEFDVHSLRPTYKLLIGIPGKSNAFAISKRLGLPDSIIADATKRIDEDSQSFEDLLSDLDSSRRQIEKERAEIERLKAETKELKEKSKEKQNNANKQKDNMLRNANEMARKILAEAKEYADKTINEINKMANSPNSVKELEKKRAGLREKINEADAYMEKHKPKKKKSNKKIDFKEGDSVLVVSMNIKGVIIKAPNAKGEAKVQMGILNSMININDLELLENDEPVYTGSNITISNQGKIKMSKTANISPEVNLIGMTCDEAVSVLDKYLDDAYLAHLPNVRVVHGRGTGALKNAVHNHLRRLKYVDSYRLGEFGEGGGGVTIVEFK